ncbi:peptidoglycan glycosyltransferase FtsW [Polymorphobacter fuscus]|uniref:Probable peptidoglycan glycosyltransferase FtsW n=1 Tax=Sandarakinorhabdus fusca TaxID=1439888 RepID=A0A7C9KZT1_9SPHN|nr:putative peptidoglycan glycosyltransferase FtsW [Polymorphobacter fuscus]KAB7644462.1 cell division protein FtsW [Polymorphobacter fuscus]MQT18388.1 cell division protein FtsW [Polymorphobacter fuscus]NJC08288.1 cell division protein FtsW [Polymorphobacter fuscus]
MASRPWAPAATTFSRGDRTALGRWFWTVDKLLVTLVLVLIACGIIAVAAASPAAAQRLSGRNFKYEDLFFLKRQIFWVVAGLPVMFGVSMLPIAWAKRFSIVGTVVLLVCLMLVPFFGAGANGAQRWLLIGSFQFQPSEFFKPLFIVTTAWLLALRFEDRSLPTMQLSFGLVIVVAALLIQQPDFGQTALIMAVWLVQAMLAGMSIWVLVALATVATLGMGLAYLTVDHVASRIDKFLTGGGDTYQIDKALDCFRAGGLFGVGPGEGQMKFRLPEAQTDYIFSVIGEEFGMIACLVIAMLYIAIVVRTFILLLDEEDPFAFLAAAGLATQFGLQATINMMVNLKLLPSKGMTLPFISHGGSSFLALCMGMGLLLALTRRNPYRNASPYAERWRA